MENKIEVITLCGSTRFKDEFNKVQQKLALEGNVVISLDIFTSVEEKVNETEEMINLHDAVHRKKIEISDAIFVINKNGYIGSSTRSEINYAVSLGKSIRYLEPVQTYSAPW